MRAGHERELLEYQTDNGRCPFREWMDGIKDMMLQAKIDARLLRVRRGNFGDARPVGDGIHELRVQWGPGYRVYFAPDGERLVILLAGGSKKTQAADIRKAKASWESYRRRKT